MNGDIIRKETIAQMPAGNAKFLMDSVFELAQRINHFRLSDAEIGLFCAIVIITAGKQRIIQQLTLIRSSVCSFTYNCQVFRTLVEQFRHYFCS